MRKGKAKDEEIGRKLVGGGRKIWGDSKECSMVKRSNPDDEDRPDPRCFVRVKLSGFAERTQLMIEKTMRGNVSYKDFPVPH